MIPPGTYLLFGKTGAGKSSLVNSIGQSSYAKTSNSHACTSTIDTYSFETPAGRYLIYDTPGLCEDEDVSTDDQYISEVIRFLSDQPIITILFVVRSDVTRLRSEDIEVIRGLARILSQRHTPVCFVATNFNFSSSIQCPRDSLRRLRAQYLIALDSELLLLTQRRLCIGGFLSSYGVDNVRRVWLEDFGGPIPVNEPLDIDALESSLGHKIRDLRIWIHRAGHDPSTVLCSDLFFLFAGRLWNLGVSSALKQSELKPDFLSIQPARLMELSNRLLSSRFSLYKLIGESDLIDDYEEGYNLVPAERTIELVFSCSGSTVDISISSDCRAHIPQNVDIELSGVLIGFQPFYSALQALITLEARGFSKSNPLLISHDYDLDRSGEHCGIYEEDDCNEDWIDESDRGVDYGYRDDDDYYE